MGKQKISILKSLKCAFRGPQDLAYTFEINIKAIKTYTAQL
jgi:hypothetical protein